MTKKKKKALGKQAPFGSDAEASTGETAETSEESPWEDDAAEPAKAPPEPKTAWEDAEPKPAKVEKPEVKTPKAEPSTVGADLPLANIPGKMRKFL